MRKRKRKNATGATRAVGDIYTILRLLLAPPDILVNATGERMVWYAPIKEAKRFDVERDEDESSISLKSD